MEKKLEQLNQAVARLITNEKSFFYTTEDLLFIQEQLLFKGERELDLGNHDAYKAYYLACLAVRDFTNTLKSPNTEK